MNGLHDMGGMQCYGAVLPEKNEPLFHADWERDALALTVAMGFTGMWNLDLSRSARESLPPQQYLSSSYYQIWIAGLERLMSERGMTTAQEIETGKLREPPVHVRQVLDGEAMRKALAAGGPVSRKTDRSAMFSAGDRVRSRQMDPAGHTRLPRYVRGKPGVVEAVNGCHVFPDSNASGSGEDPQWLYTVRFEAGDLFGGNASHSVLVDCWEPYLERL
ncbi:MAG: nitrile hydratase subunit beta [Rhizobiaceae bacterium]